MQKIEKSLKNQKISHNFYSEALFIFLKSIGIEIRKELAEFIEFKIYKKYLSLDSINSKVN